MGSIVFNNQSQPGTTDIPGKGTIEGIANKILGAVNPQQAFNNLLSQNKDAQNAMNLCNQYGNGDPKTAFMNYAAQNGKEAIAKTIMNKLGLG